MHLNFLIIKPKFMLEPGQTDGSGCCQIPRLRAAPASAPKPLVNEDVVVSAPDYTVAPVSSLNSETLSVSRNCGRVHCVLR